MEVIETVRHKSDQVHSLLWKKKMQMLSRVQCAPQGTRLNGQITARISGTFDLPQH